MCDVSVSAVQQCEPAVRTHVLPLVNLRPAPTSLSVSFCQFHPRPSALPLCPVFLNAYLDSVWDTAVNPAACPPDRSSWKGHTPGAAAPEES